MRSCPGANIIKLGNNISHEVADALKVYLKQYLEFLKTAGNHVFFDLPDFDDTSYSPHSDFSRIATEHDIKAYGKDVTVHGIEIDELNKFLRNTYLGLHDHDHEVDPLDLALAEISSQSLTNSSTTEKFFIKFGVPTITALCPQEIILTFHIARVAFFESDDFNKYVRVCCLFFLLSNNSLLGSLLSLRTGRSPSFAASSWRLRRMVL
jgi:hypothetical protein